MLPSLAWSLAGTTITISGTPDDSERNPMPYSAEISASDGYSSISATLNITVELNNAPSIVTPLQNQNSIAGIITYSSLGAPFFDYDVSNIFEDVDGDSISLDVRLVGAPYNLPAYMSFDGSVITVDTNYKRLRFFYLTATDSKGASSQGSFRVFVTNNNPTMVLLDPLTIYVGNLYSQTFNFTQM